MNVNLVINLAPDEQAGDLGKTANEIAEGLLTLLNGDPAKDVFIVNIQDMGLAGATAPVPPLSPP